MKKLILVSTSIIFFIAVNILLTIQANKKADRYFAKFHQAEIDGVLAGLTSGASGVNITVDDSIQYSFKIKRNKRDSSSFEDIAKVGDTIRKYSHDNRLILMKNNRKYVFECFAKWGDSKE